MVRDAIGEPPRSFGVWDRVGYLRVRRPGWAGGDPIRLFFNGRKRLLQSGYVTWGSLVQANYLLWQLGRDNAPGEVIFSSDPRLDADPAVLEAVANRLYEFKESPPTNDPEAGAIGRHLAAGTTRAFGMPVPRSVRAPLPLVLSTTYFYRPHLPNPRFLCQRILPLLVSPTDPQIVMVVPARYWPAPLLTWWRES